MAYQPIQMPQPQGMNGLAELLLQARRQEQQDEQARAELLLRTQQHEAQVTQNYAHQQQNAQQMGLQGAQLQAQLQKARAAAVQEVTSALDSGRSDLARQIAQANGINLQELTDQRPDRDRLMAPSTEIKNPPPATDGVDFADQGEVDAQFFQPAGYAPRRTQYEIAGIPYDPEQKQEADKAARARKAEQAREAFAGMPDYANRAAALAQAPDDIAKDMNQQMVADDRSQAANDRAVAAAERKAALDAIYRDTPDDRMARTRLAASMGLEGRKGIAEAMGGGKADQNTLAAVKYVDDTIQKAARNTGYSKLRETDQMLANAEAQINSNSGSGQFGALMLLGRAMRGGAATEFVSEEERKHLSGAVGRIEGYIQSFKNGQYSDEQRDSVREEIRAGRLLMSRLLDRSGQAMATTLREDPAIVNLKGTANAKYRSYMQGIGRNDAPALFPDETNNVPALGSNIVKGGGSYHHLPPEQSERQPNRVSVSGPLGAFQDALQAEKDREAKRARALTGAPEDVNSDAPLPEDPNAEELPPAQEFARPGKPKSVKPAGKPRVTKEQALEELRRRGLIP